MNKYLPLCLFALTPLITVRAQQEANAQPDSGEAFAFIGVTALKPYQKEMMPIVGASRNRLEVQTAKGIKRVRFGSGNVGLETKIVTASNYASIGELDYNFGNLAQSRRDARYQADLEAEASYAEDQIDMINASPASRVPGQPRHMDKQTYAESLARNAEISRDLQEEAFFSESHRSDIIYLSLDVVPEADIKDAYGVLVTTNTTPAQQDGDAGKSVFSNIVNFGDLQNGVPNKVKFSVGTFEQVMGDLDFRFFLFAGDGTPIATNRSGPMKRVSAEEVRALQQQSKVLTR